MSGFIKIHRALLDWEWYHDDRCVRLLLHLILKANYTHRRWKGQELQPGQLITSTVSLAEQLGWSRSTLNRTLDKLRDGQEIETKADSKWTLVTLRKWEQFQIDGEDVDSKRTSNRTASGHQTIQQVIQQADTDKEGKKERKKEEREQRVTAPPRMSFEIFKQACRDVHKKSAILSNEEAKAFFEYWTEGSATGKGRWQSQKVFDIALRMGTWKKRIKATDAPTVSAHLKDPNRKIIEGWQPLT